MRLATFCGLNDSVVSSCIMLCIRQLLLCTVYMTRGDRHLSHTQSNISLLTLTRALLRVMGQTTSRKTKNKKKQKTRFKDDDSKRAFASITSPGLSRATPRPLYSVFARRADPVRSQHRHERMV